MSCTFLYECDMKLLLPSHAYVGRGLKRINCYIENVTAMHISLSEGDIVVYYFRIYCNIKFDYLSFQDYPKRVAFFGRRMSIKENGNLKKGRL